ncbi:MAG: threonine/serine dehydratase [Verrucomicrobiales bacterium]|nr:threonine/serine dehydratase [Verrucomicrobiales bacterium]
MKRLYEIIRPTTVIEATRLSHRLGLDLTIVSETFQHTGSFKFRAAYNVAQSVPHKMIITASSGNFGQAMAYACQMLGKTCVVVMPDTSAQVKIAAVREYGGMVDLIDTRTTSRSGRVRDLGSANSEAYLASAYDDPLVIAGNATLGEEIAHLRRPIDLVLAPMGGGGLTSGIITGLRRAGNPIAVLAAEPLTANDAARSLRAGRIVANESEPQTLADGARTVSVGEHNWAIIREGLAEIIEVTEEQIREAVRLLFSLANLKTEPTGALALAALLAAGQRFRGRSICCVVSGGNVDPALFRELLA